MTDRQFLRLNENWDLASDNQQWIIRRRKKRGDGCYWQGVRYIGEKKSTLVRDLGELGVQIDPKAQAYIDQMPDTFLEYRRTSDAEIERLVEQDKEDGKC